MNKKVLATVFLAALLTVSQIVLIMQVQSLKKLINDLEDKTEEYEESVCDFQKKQDLQISKINEEIKIVLEKQEENTSLIKNELNLVKQKSEAQFSKTVVMSKTYDAILEEQKKRTIDTAEKDTDFIESKRMQ